MRLTKTVFGIALLPVVLTSGVLLLLLHHLDDTQEQRASEQRARKALADDLKVADALVGSGLSLYKYALDLEDGWLDRVRLMQDRVPPIVEELDKVCVEPETRATAYESAAETAKFFAITEELIWSAPLGETEFCPIRTLAIRQNFKPQADKVVAISERLRKQIIADTQRSPQSSLVLQSGAPQYEQWGLLATTLGSFIVAGLLSRNIINRLGVIQDNSTRLVEGAPLRAPVGGDDEIADLDATFHKMADELAAARKREQDAVDNSADVILVVDGENKLRRVNAAVKEWGFSPEHLEGKPLSAIVPPDLLPAMASFLDDLRARGAANAVGAGFASGAFESAVGLDESELIVEVLWSAQFSASDGVLFCVLHDIGERKRMERLLAESAAREELLLERAPAVLLTFGDDLSIKDANATALKLFDVEQAEQLLGKTVTSCIHVTESEQSGDAATQTNASNFIADLRKRAFGKVISVDVLRGSETVSAKMSVDEIATGDGTVFLAVLLDQSERQELAKLKERLWNMIATEIAAPLATINSRLHMFSAGSLGELTENGQRKVEGAEVESQRLMRLFQDLLRVDRDVDVRLSIETARCSLDELIGRAIDATQVHADRVRIRVDAAANSSPIYLSLDGDRMVQVLVNLITNALKFSPENGRIQIATYQSDGWNTIEVTDEGPGIPVEMVERVFQPFVQARLEDATMKGGSGLGLAICRRIVEAHGGTISVRNNPDRGCTFEIRLPTAEQR